MAIDLELSRKYPRVLVTGATGLVGNNVARLLVDQGVAVRALVRSPRDPRALAGLPIEVVGGDVTDGSSLRAAFNGIQAVVHAAGCVLLGWRNADLHACVNHGGTQQMATAARAAGARMVHVSTINTLGFGTRDRLADETWSAGPNIACPYVTSKQAAERSVREQIEQGLDACIVHPGLMFGPWDWKPSSGRMLIDVVRRFTPLAPAGGISVCDVRDVAQGIVAALAHAPAGRAFVLAGHNVTYLKLWQQFVDIAGGRRPLCRSGPLMRIVAGRIGDLWGRLSGREPDVNSAAIGLSDQYHYFSSARAQRELGYQIRPLEQSIRDAWHWFQEYGFV
ncbi:MAG: NAD-dependent epimerase/dehydratase family protein [Pirellulaceae bacterium]